MTRKGSFPVRVAMRRPMFLPALVLAIGLAIGWWLVAARVSQKAGTVLWSDQHSIYTQLDANIADPYASRLFANPPWTAVLVYPVALLPFETSVLIQIILYFSLLTLLIAKFGGKFWTVVLVLTSSLAYDSALEMSLEWLVVIGLLVPRVWSGPFLLVKPQAALGAWFGFRPRQIFWAGVVALIVAGLSFLIWPNWLEGMQNAFQNNIFGAWGTRVNISLSRGLPRPVAWGIGLLLALLAFRRGDVILGVLAWQFLVPYATFYGSMPAFALLAVRWPLIAFAISAAAWIPYSQVLLPFL